MYHRQHILNAQISRTKDLQTTVANWQSTQPTFDNYYVYIYIHVHAHGCLYIYKYVYVQACRHICAYMRRCNFCPPLLGTCSTPRITPSITQGRPTKQRTQDRPIKWKPLEHEYLAPLPLLQTANHNRSSSLCFMGRSCVRSLGAVAKPNEQRTQDRPMQKSSNIKQSTTDHKNKHSTTNNEQWTVDNEQPIIDNPQSIIYK